MLKKILILAIIAAFVVSCDDEKEAIPVQYFQVTIDNSIITNISDDWLVLQDEAGNLLSAKRYESGDVITFDSTKVISSPLTLTFFSSGAQNSTFLVKTYTNLNAGEKLILKSSFPLSEQGPSQGALTVTVNGNNLGHQFNATISNKFREEISSANSTPTSIIFRPREIYSNANDFLICVSDNGRIPKYKFIENATTANLAFSFDELSPFDKTVVVSLPAGSSQSLATVQGFEADQTFNTSHGYRMSYFLEGVLGLQSIQNYTLGYLNRFTRYYTIVSANYPGYSLSYFAKGSAPSGNIIISKPDIIITNNTVTGFSVNGSDFDWRSTQFSSQGQAWIIYSDKHHLKNPELPASFLIKFPEFKPSLLKYAGTSFNKGTTYEDSVLGELRGQQAQETFTVLQINL